MDPPNEREAVIEHLSSMPLKISHGPVQLMTPPLDTDPNSPVSQRSLSICRELVDRRMQLQGAPYGTDAAWAGRRCPSVVIGPGDICHAHTVDEHISLSELATAVKIYKRIMLEPFPQLP
jgi:acetylornithine deacetylase